MDSAIVDRLAEAEVLVVGDVLLDRFIEGRVTRVSREAPVPVLNFGSVRAMMGGACNVAANILATGGRVSLVGIRGTDPAADELTSLFRGFSRLSAHLVEDASRRTTVKTRYLHGWQQLLCIDSGDLAPASPVVRDKLVAAAVAAMPGASVVVLSDYGRGALDDDSIRSLIAASRAAGRQVLVDPRRADAAVFGGAALITPNLEEMRAFTGILASTDDLAEQASRLVLERSPIDAVLLTRGSGGMTLVERGHPPIHIRAETHRVFDVTGAGDTVVATIASALAVGAPLAEAVQLANTAAGIAVSKPGTATVHPQELRQALGAPRDGGIASWDDAAENVELWQGLGLKVGFTNGVFDLLHRGHLHSLEQARSRVDRLVVGLNTDASVKRLKGPDRPVQDEHARGAILAALRYVDLVVMFEQDTPADLIAALRPDVLFKGTDYANVEIPGADFVKAHGGSVELLPLLEGHSTTRTVAKLRGRA
jgi:D-beta-D-heptose 7-phosphate kinase/D-beta-D-heptose 1-phosphate adenosyltransferase